MQRVTIMCHDMPYPPNHGGRIAMLNRIKALNKKNIQIQVIAWTKHIDQSHVEHLKKYCSDIIVFKSNLRYSMLKLKWPFGVASHTLSANKQCELQNKIKTFGSKIIFVDGIYSADPAIKTAEALDIPIAYLSHNIEFLHMVDQVKSSAKVSNKIRYLFDAPRMYFTEKLIRKKSDYVFDICEEDKSFWARKIGSQSAVILPAIAIREPDVIDTQNDIDILYTGNLYNSNNLDGLIWFIKNVFAEIVKTKQVKMVVAGSNPKKELVSICKEFRIELIKNPIDMQEYYKRAKLLVNPVMQVNGINIKMIEMLSTGKPVVSTSNALRGLPDNPRSFVYVADNPSEYADKITILLKKEATINMDQISSVRDSFNERNHDKLIELIIDE